MQSILNMLKTGSGKERLAVIADIMSIVGISLATALGGAFALNAKLNAQNTIAVLAGGLLFLAVIVVVLVIFLIVSSWISQVWASNLFIGKLLQLSAWLAFAALFLCAIYLSYLALSSIQFFKS